MSKKKVAKKQTRPKKNHFPKNWKCTNPQLSNCKPCGDKPGGCGQCGGDKLACIKCPACIRRFRINPKQDKVDQKLDLMGKLRDKMLASKQSKELKSFCEQLVCKVLNGKETGVEVTHRSEVSKNADQATTSITFTIFSQE